MLAQRGVGRRVTFRALLVPALPVLGASTLGIGSEGAVSNEKTWGQRRATQDPQASEAWKAHLLSPPRQAPPQTHLQGHAALCVLPTPTGNLTLSLSPTAFAIIAVVITEKTWTFWKTHDSEIGTLKSRNSLRDFLSY